MSVEIEHIRFKEVRESLKITQADFAQQLNIPSCADIERGKVRITGKVIMKLLRHFEINPLWMYGESTQKHLTHQPTPKVVSLTSDGEQENILMVNQKASAGYGQNIGDPEFYHHLPAFHLPLPQYRNASFRGFQIMGDSMVPLVQPGDWVLAKAVSSFENINLQKPHIVVEKESIRLKKLVFTPHSPQIQLLSLNPEYPPISIHRNEVLELWEYHSKISFGIERVEGLTLQKVYDEVKNLKDKLD